MAALPVARDRRRAPTTSRCPAASRMLAPVMARSPWPHITVSRAAGDASAVGEVAELDVDRAGDVAGVPFVRPGGRRAPFRPCRSAVDERDRLDREPGGRPGGDAAVELAEDRVVADGEALADEVGAVGVVVEDEHDGPVEGDEPAEPAGEHAPVLDRERTRRMCAARSRRWAGRRRARRRRRAWRRTVSRSSRGEGGELGVEARAAPVDLGQLAEVGGEAAEAVEQRGDEAVLVVDAQQRVGGPLGPMVVVRAEPDGAEQNDPAPWVG